VKLAGDKIDKPVAYRPFQPAVAPMDAAVRAFKLCQDWGLDYRLHDSLVLGADDRHTPQPLRTAEQSGKFARVHAHCLGARHVADRGKIDQTQFAAEEIPTAQFTFEHAEKRAKLL